MPRERKEGEGRRGPVVDCRDSVANDLGTYAYRRNAVLVTAISISATSIHAVVPHYMYGGV
jgi:hypothetical protein